MNEGLAKRRASVARGLRARLRRRVGAVVMDSLWEGLAAAGRLHPMARAGRHGVELLRDIPYTDSGRVEHLLDVYRPARGSGPWPVVLYAHGGGFRILSKDSHWIMGLAFARRGYLVCNINYRLAPRHRFPAGLEDACAAYTWVVEHAADYGGDPARLVLAGESAGANLVTTLAVAACFARPEPFARAVRETNVVPRAVLPACGMLQVTDAARFARRRRLSTLVTDRLLEVEDEYLGHGPRAPGALDLADPLLVLEGDAEPARPLPPFFAAVGTRDPLLDDTRRLEAALARRGVACEARYYPGEMHAFHALVFRPQARRAWRDTFAFLARHLG